MPKYQPAERTSSGGEIPQTEFEKGEAEHPEIEELKKRIKRLEGKLEKEREKEKGFEREEKMVKKEIKSYLKELQRAPPSAPPVASRDEVEEIARFPRSQQVGSLISLVFDKGLKEAISVARGLDNPAILDEFHDTLVDRYYNELVKRNIL